MNYMHILIIGAVVILAALIGFLSVRYLGPNNPVEKAAEQVIKAETGLDVNLDPPTTAKDSVNPAALSSSSSGNMPTGQPAQRQSTGTQSASTTPKP